ncbi:MAG: hypothetical protein NTZ59_10610 [Bacteroidetes bacterium]|nr:hypothetical protein [Bacteroidota bacterium]
MKNETLCNSTTTTAASFSFAANAWKKRRCEEGKNEKLIVE